MGGSEQDHPRRIVGGRGAAALFERPDIRVGKPDRPARLRKRSADPQLSPWVDDGFQNGRILDCTPRARRQSRMPSVCAPTTRRRTGTMTSDRKDIRTFSSSFGGLTVAFSGFPDMSHALNLHHQHRYDSGLIAGISRSKILVSGSGPIRILRRRRRRPLAVDKRADVS